MSNKNEEKSFWRTLPGILTGIAAVISAIGGLILALNAAGIIDTIDTPVTSTPTPVATNNLTPTIIPTSTPTPTPTPQNMEFVLISTGKFDMGSPANDTYSWDSERPVHHVKIASAFYMGKYEITQKQWRDIMGTNPSNFKGDDLPVENVSWNEVQNFIQKLNQKEGTNKYRLPSEAEWEYAARAGTTTMYSFGNDESELGEYAWYAENSGDKTHPVGQKNPNKWGLYDIHGNVWEWVQDSWHADYDGAPDDGSAWEDGSGAHRVNRGGGWYDLAGSCRLAGRIGSNSDLRYYGFGFRLVKDL